MAKNAKDKYIGKVFPQNCGYNATVIDYVDAMHVTVQFDDENQTKKIVRLREMKNGECMPMHKALISAKEKYIGQIFLQKCGYSVKIIDYTDYNHVTVQFTDEKKSTFLVSMYAVNSGRCLPSVKNVEDKYIGNTFRQKSGYDATVIEYIDSKHVKVEFNDKCKTCRIVSPSELKLGRCLPLDKKTLTRNKYIGNTFHQQNGYDATVIEYIDSSHIKVRFNDDEQCIRVVSGSALRSGQCRPKKRNIIGNSYLLKNGLKVTVIGYVGSDYKHIQVYFDDIDYTKKITNAAGLTNGTVAHPDLSFANKQRNFYGYYVTSKPIHIDDQTFYFAKEIDTGEEVFMTPHMMMEEYKKKNK